VVEFGDEPDEVVIVTGTQASHMAGAVQVIGRKQLERNNYDDPHSVLRQVPGVFVREEDGMGLRPNIAMRGVNPDRSKKINLTEDGVLLGPAPYSAPAAYYFPMITRMTQVQIIKGPGAIAFGPQTVAGSIDLITRSIPAEPSLGIDVGVGQYGYNKAHVFAGTSSDQFGFLVEGVHVGSSGSKELPNEANTGATRDEWMAKMSYLLDPHASVSNEFTLKLGYSQEASNETYLGLSDQDFIDDPNRRYPASNLDRMDNHRTSFALAHEANWYDRNIALKTTLYRNDFFRVWRKFNRLGGASAAEVLEDPTDSTNAAYYGVLTGETDSSGLAQDTLFIGPNQRAFVSQGVATRLRYETQARIFSQKMEMGLRLHNDSIERVHSERGYDMLNGDLYPDDKPAEVTTQNVGSTYAMSLYFTDAVTWRDLTLTPGIRFEVIHSLLDDQIADTESRRSLLAAMPGLGAYYALTKNFGLLAGAYRGFSPPPPGSNEDIRPESSINYEAGARFSDRGTKAELIGFFNDYQNLTDICTFSDGCIQSELDQQFDAGRANIYGLEAMANHNLVWKEVTFPLSFAYTLSYGEFETDFDSIDPIYGVVVKGDQIPYLPRHQFFGQLAFEWDRLSAYGAVTYVSQTREEAGNEPYGEVLSTEALLSLDVGAAVDVLTWLQLYANARNLLDNQVIVSHRPYGARPNAPRWVQMGVKMFL
jgi:Fe(3+) dicitrate transport protein